MPRVERAASSTPSAGESGAARLDSLLGEVRLRYEMLPAHLQAIGAYLMSHADRFALGTITRLGAEIGVQPSTIVRFAKSFGLRGYSDLQEICRGHLLESLPAYRDRKLGGDALSSPDDGLELIIRENIAALNRVKEQPIAEDIGRAAGLLRHARTIFVVGFGDSLALAVDTVVKLNRLARPAVHIDGIGTLNHGRALLGGKQDVLVAAAFRPYSPTTVEIVRAMHDRLVPVVAITDTILGPHARLAEVSLRCGDPADSRLGSLAAPLCVVQALLVAMEKLEAAGR